VRKKHIAHFLQLFVFAVLFYAVLCLLPGCSTTSNTMVPDIGTGTAEYRELQTEQREGEAELAITGAKLEAGLGELERSISASQRSEQEIGNIIQQIREREVDASFIEGWRNSRTETGSGR